MRLFLIFFFNFQAFTFSQDIYAFLGNGHKIISDFFFNFQAFTFSRDIFYILGQWTQKCGFKKDFTPLVPNLRNISMEANSGGKPNSEM